MCGQTTVWAMFIFISSAAAFWPVRSAGPSSRSQWALPNLNRQLLIAGGTAGPQLMTWAYAKNTISKQMPESMAEKMSEWMSEGRHRRCQKTCHYMGSQSKWMSENRSDRMPEKVSDNMSKNGLGRRQWMSEQMSEDVSDRMPDRMWEDMSDRMPDEASEDMSDRPDAICQIECQKQCQI